jgi:hypothetical protein
MMSIHDPQTRMTGVCIVAVQELESVKQVEDEGWQQPASALNAAVIFIVPCRSDLAFPAQLASLRCLIRCLIASHATTCNE